MTWTRLDDNWSPKIEQRLERADDRWHLVAMIQFACRTDRYDGALRLVDARRASDHEDPDAAIDRMVTAGLVERIDGKVVIVGIEAHVPPPHVRNKAEGDRIRKRRERAHKAGDHSLCDPSKCVAAMSRVTSAVTPGRDGTGQDGADDSNEVREGEERVTEWPTVQIPQTPGYCEHGVTVGGRCSRCPEERAA